MFNNVGTISCVEIQGDTMETLILNIIERDSRQEKTKIHFSLKITFSQDSISYFYYIKNTIKHVID